MGRHSGAQRFRQKFFQKGSAGNGGNFVVSGTAKKFQNLSTGQWRNMFPELVSVPDSEVASRGLALLRQREKGQ